MMLKSLVSLLLVLLWLGAGAAQVLEDDVPSVAFKVDRVTYTKFDGQGSLPLYLSTPVDYAINVTLTANSFTGEERTITFEAGQTRKNVTFQIENVFSTSNVVFSVAIGSISPSGTAGNISSVEVHIQYKSIVTLAGHITVTEPSHSTTSFYGNVTMSWPSNSSTTVKFGVATPYGMEVERFGYVEFSNYSVSVPAGETWALIPFTYTYATSFLLPNLTIYLIESDTADVVDGELLVTFPVPTVQSSQQEMMVLSNEGAVRIPFSVQPVLWADEVILFQIYDVIENVTTTANVTVQARRTQQEIIVSIDADEVSRPDRLWVVTIPSSDSYLIVSNISVDVTIMDEIVYFAMAELLASPSGELAIPFALRIPSAVDVEVKYTISDDQGVLNTSYTTIPAGQSGLWLNVLFPPNDQQVNITYQVDIENALNATTSDAREYPRRASIMQLPPAQPTIAPPTNSTQPSTNSTEQPTPPPSNSTQPPTNSTEAPVLPTLFPNVTAPTDTPSNNDTNSTIPIKPPTSFPTRRPPTGTPMRPTATPTPLPSPAPDPNNGTIVGETPRGDEDRGEDGMATTVKIIIGVVVGFFGLLAIVAALVLVIMRRRRTVEPPTFERTSVRKQPRFGIESMGDGYDPKPSASDPAPPPSPPPSDA